jgi:hypothetical protein
LARRPVSGGVGTGSAPPVRYERACPTPLASFAALSLRPRAESSLGSGADPKSDLCQSLLFELFGRKRSLLRLAPVRSSVVGRLRSEVAYQIGLDPFSHHCVKAIGEYSRGDERRHTGFDSRYCNGIGFAHVLTRRRHQSCDRSRREAPFSTVDRRAFRRTRRVSAIRYLAVARHEPDAKGDPQRAGWPAPGSEDTELDVLMELEVRHGETEVYP